MVNIPSASDAEFMPTGFDEAAVEQRQRRSTQKKEKKRRKAARKKACGLVKGEELQLVRSGGGCRSIAAVTCRNWLKGSWLQLVSL